MPTITDPASFIGDFLSRMTREVMDGEDHATVIDRYHTPDVLETADGIEIDRDKLIAHLGPIQRTLRDFRVEVHEAIAEGDTLAARFTIHAEQAKHTTVTDVHFFGRFADDGRLRRAHQLTSVRSREPASQVS